METYDHDAILEHWNSQTVESMYDKHLLEGEISLISRFIPPGTKLLDAGCGEGEGTLAYAQIEGVDVCGADFSDTRLKKAAERLRHCANVRLEKVDFTRPYELERDFDVVVSQRFLINITDWELQRRILTNLLGLLRPGGLLVLMEGCVQGTAELNRFRGLMGLAEIAAPWHNRFLDDEALKAFMEAQEARLECEDGLGSYYLLTRGVRPLFDADLGWDSPFNRMAAQPEVDALLGLNGRCSRVKLWAFRKGAR